LALLQKLRKVTDYDLIPLGSNCFLPKNRIGFNNEKPLASSMQAPPGHPNPWAALGYPPHPFMLPQYYPYPPPQYPPTQFGFALQGPPMAPSSNGFYGTQSHTIYPTSDSGQGSSNPQFSGAGPSIPSARMGVDQWCDKFDLGDEERDGLKKLGFRVGDDLTTVDEGMWDYSGLGPLHRQRILAAFKASL
jgi:hypothetical protein